MHYIARVFRPVLCQWPERMTLLWSTSPGMRKPLKSMTMRKMTSHGGCISFNINFGLVRAVVVCTMLENISSFGILVWDFWNKEFDGNLLFRASFCWFSFRHCWSSVWFTHCRDISKHYGLRNSESGFYGPSSNATLKKVILTIIALTEITSNFETSDFNVMFSSFNGTWLRHLCHCPKCKQANSGQWLYNPADLSPTYTMRSVSLQGEFTDHIGQICTVEHYPWDWASG